MQLYLERGKLKLGLMLAAAGLFNEIVDGYRGTFNDGLWHTVNVFIGHNQIEMTVDGILSRTTRVINIKPGVEYFVGGKYL